ncbi:MAG TPA: LPS assembly lipoprotein LptE [Rhizomicrobium sp.]|jgi:LPS-assembly lipoprotein|nr:LPS assembly lipoprotein LptE [Rhizomicrobium sp.]
MKAHLLVSALLLSGAFGTAGCGFHPLFARVGSSGGGQQAFDSVYVDPIVAERAGYELRDSLIDLLEGVAHQQDAQYRLKVAVKQTIEGTAVQTNGDITRYTYTMVADYELSNIHTGAEITKGSETAVEGYDVVASPYATLVAQQDAQKSAAHDIADRIRIDLGVYFIRRSSG